MMPRRRRRLICADAGAHIERREHALHPDIRPSDRRHVLENGGVPELPPDIAAVIRAVRPISSDAGPAWVLDLDEGRGQQLKQWCDAKRAQATEQEPNNVWTRIVARVNEVVQPFVPATEPGHSPVRRDPAR